MFGARLLRRWLEELPDSALFSGRWRTRMQYLALTILVSLFLTSSYLLVNQREEQGGFSIHNYLSSKSRYFDFFWNQTASASRTHPIDDLIGSAHVLHANLLKEQSHDVGTAAARYRARRGRHPPPGFEHWVAYALDHDAVLVESFFDRIYADVAPFWGRDPALTAAQASDAEFVVRVRNGSVNSTGDTEGHVPWVQLWSGLIEEAAPFLPDVDMPVNMMDESRVVAKWEDINKMLEKEQASRKVMRARNETVGRYTGLAAVDVARTTTTGDDKNKQKNKKKPKGPKWESGNYWDFTRTACAPDSPSQKSEGLKMKGERPELPGKEWQPEFTYEGYVRNYTASLDPCTQPHLRGLHGTFAEPLSIATSKQLVPLFGGCKLTTNNDILIPGAMYLTDDPMYSGGDSHGPEWRDKNTGAVWRGVASGGRNKAANWRHFQRHRLIEMLNGTAVSAAEKRKDRSGETFQMPSKERYGFAKLKNGGVGKWLSSFANAGFTELLCFPDDSGCDYVNPYLHTVSGIPMKEQYAYKYMPDVDGNSFSARFRGFLLSTSLPIKASIYAEWHDDRLVPWLHFAPMDNTFRDLYAILDYFSRDANGDRAANFIAEEGRAWSNRVLRREDMLLYVWRLLLEFARVCDEKRDQLGYVDDLT
ncbi:glycosyltransferase family 90 protein [Astrocystis sublimbata]|nr:glycosyltransferase family 90 protein [Astrocystis sublimbata]